jgi:hypothetical protein
MSFSMKSRYQNFLCDNRDKRSLMPRAYRTIPISQFQAISPQLPEREIIKHTLIGSTQAVTATIRVLYQLGYADMLDWSPLVPTDNPGEVMSILVRAIAIQ